MRIVEKQITQLKPYARNPRKNAAAVDPVAESIKNFGFLVPLVITQGGEIVAGHTRLKAAEKIGLERVPCVLADDLTQEQIKAFRLADNKTGEIATWIPELLAEELREICSIDMTAFGFAEPKPEPDEDAVPDPPKKPKSRKGQIYSLGRHRLMVGSATSADDVALLMDGAKAKCVITDPPYNVDYTGKTKDSLKIENDKMEEDAFLSFLLQAFKVFSDFLMGGGSFYIWHADSIGRVFREAAQRAGLTVRQCLIWLKNVMVLGRQDYQWRHEPCLYGWKDGAAHHFVNDRTETTVIPTDDLQRMKKADLIKLVERLQAETPTTIIEEDKPNRNALHPTMKPVKLIARLIRNSTKPGDIVLDTFGGSGTTLIACEQMGRMCRMMELDPKYADVIIKRWEEYTGEKAQLLNDEKPMEKEDHGSV